MATLSPKRSTQRIDRPHTAPPRTGSGGILRTSSSSECDGESLADLPRSVPSNISFAPLPEIEPRKRRSNRPLGVAARSVILHRQRANLTKHSYPTHEAGFQYHEQPPSFDIPGDAQQMWPGGDDSQYDFQTAMASCAPEPSNTESPTIVYVENGQPHQPEPSQAQVSVSVSTPKRNRSRKGSPSKLPSNPDNPSDWAAEEGALNELRKLGTKEKDANEGSALKFWRRLGKRSSTPLLSLVKIPNDQTPELPITAAVPTPAKKLVRNRTGKQLARANPPALERRPSVLAENVFSPSIVISPVEVEALRPSELEPSIDHSGTSTAASSSPPTPELRIQSVSPVEVSDSYDIAPTPRPLAANDAKYDEDRDTPLPGIETKRHSEEPYSQYERPPFRLTSSASI